MYKKLLCYIVVFAAYYAANAQYISHTEALHIATSFMPDRHFTNVQSIKRMKADGEMFFSPYYVFNTDEGNGYVIVSGDERIGQILGYDENGVLDMDSLPENVSWWLGLYENAIKYIHNSDIEKSKTANVPLDKTTERPTIEPLLKSKWNQYSPYNNKCPLLDEKRCVTGCVATAVAQIMNYYRSPLSSKATFKYRTKTNKINIPALPATDFDWENILNEYSSQATDAEKDAVATLLLYCGCALSMDYGLDGSGADSTPVCDAMEYFFGYDESIKKVYRSDYDSEEWEELLYGELSKSYPVYYSGRTNGNAGHAFVCDGYDNGFFHINWGWGGYCDGHFKLSVLDPYIGNYSDSESSDGYASEQMAVINIVPKDFHGFETRIKDLKTDYSEVKAYFNMNGQPIPTLQKGMNIVKYADGSVKKEFIK